MCMSKCSEPSSASECAHILAEVQAGVRPPQSRQLHLSLAALQVARRLETRIWLQAFPTSVALGTLMEGNPWLAYLAKASI